jgi:hypothetical protein
LQALAARIVPEDALQVVLFLIQQVGCRIDMPCAMLLLFLLQRK